MIIIYSQFNVLASINNALVTQSSLRWHCVRECLIAFLSKGILNGNFEKFKNECITKKNAGN